MTHEFDHVRESFAISTPGQVLNALTQMVASGWRTSRIRTAAAVDASSAPTVVRIAAVAVAVAAAMQPLLIGVMPASIRPAMPAYVFIVIAVLAAAVAWQPAAAVSAWSTSMFSRRLRG